MCRRCLNSLSIEVGEEDAMNNSFLMKLSIGLECLCCAVSVAAEYQVVFFNFDIDSMRNSQYLEKHFYTSDILKDLCKKTV